MRTNEMDGMGIAARKQVFAVERKLSDNLFQLQLVEDGLQYVARLYPFALFEVSGEVEDLSVFEAMAGADGETPPFSYFQPLLILTNECNFACSYCLAYEGSYGLKLQVMPQHVLDWTIKYLRQVISSRYVPAASRDEETELGLICFGGEPFLAEALIRSAHGQLKGLCNELTTASGVSFRPTLTINTNGYKVNEDMLAFLAENAGDIELVVSYDGHIHDQNRLTKKGEVTAEQVYRNIIRLKEAGVNVTVTTCILPESLAAPQILMSSLEKIYDQSIPINLSFIRGPLEGVNDRAIYPGYVQKSYNEESLDAFGDIVAGKIANGSKIYSLRYRRRLLEGGYRYRCGAGLFEFAVAPDGQVYPCHNFVAPKNSLGNICEPDFAIDESNKLVVTLLNRQVKDLEPCCGCFFQSTCMSSFDCPAHSLHDLQDIRLVDQRFCGFARKVQQAILTRFIKEMRHEQ